MIYYHWGGKGNEFFSEVIVVHTKAKRKSILLFGLVFMLAVVLSGTSSVQRAILAAKRSVIQQVQSVSTLYFDLAANFLENGGNRFTIPKEVF